MTYEDLFHMVSYAIEESHLRTFYTLETCLPNLFEFLKLCSKCLKKIDLFFIFNLIQNYFLINLNFLRIKNINYINITLRTLMLYSHTTDILRITCLIK